jgi:uncharacterized ferritin-like protein (DUF455 family)
VPQQTHSSDPGRSARAPALRALALAVALECKADAKAALARAVDPASAVDVDETLAEPPGVPGRPARPVLVPPGGLAPRSISTREGHAALIHALAHIELNAIDLAADACWRFAGMPDAYYRDWTRVMREEALHFELLAAHLATLGHAYGDFPAHDALWQMAERTKHDVLARMALVPRTLEARGLDASPGVKRKLQSAGDRAGAAIIDIILRDEIGHVAIGNRWFAYLCEGAGLDTATTFAELAARHDAPKPKGPFNREARLAAGFRADELDALIGKG